MVDHRKRAERRRAFYESRLGDPQQLIRVIGLSSKLYPDAEQFYYHENTDNLMPWQGNSEVKIDRFDGRSLLDFLADPTKVYEISKAEEDLSEELNFERYHDLIEAERLKVTEAERLATVEEEWTKLLDRHQAKLAMLEKNFRSNKASFAFDYGTRKATPEETEELDDEKESRLLKEANILQYVDDLTDKDRQILNEMSSKYGIRSYARLLRVAKKDQDRELRALRRKEREKATPDDGLSRAERKKQRRRKRRRRRRRDEKDEYGRHRQKRRNSPSYNAYDDDDEYTDDSGTSTDGSVTDSDSEDSDVQIEFGSNSPEEQHREDEKGSGEAQSNKDSKNSNSASHTSSTGTKLTPMEKLKLKMRAGLAKTIESDERDRKQKEQEKELEQLQELARSQGLPLNAYLQPDQVTDGRKETGASSKNERYRSPSTSDEEKDACLPVKSKPRRRYRSPSTSADERKVVKPKATTSSTAAGSQSTRRYRSPSTSRSRSPNPSCTDKQSVSKRHRYRSPSTSRSRSRSRSYDAKRRRYHSTSLSRSRSRSPSHSRRSPRQSKRHYDRGRSPLRPAISSTSRHRYRSPSTSKNDERYHHNDTERGKRSYSGSD